MLQQPRTQLCRPAHTHHTTRETAGGVSKVTELKLKVWAAALHTTVECADRHLPLLLWLLQANTQQCTTHHTGTSCWPAEHHPMTAWAQSYVQPGCCQSPCAPAVGQPQYVVADQVLAPVLLRGGTLHVLLQQVLHECVLQGATEGAVKPHAAAATMPNHCRYMQSLALRHAATDTVAVGCYQGMGCRHLLVSCSWMLITHCLVQLYLNDIIVLAS
jgi:hypothetical protein